MATLKGSKTHENLKAAFANEPIGCAPARVDNRPFRS